MTTIDTSIREAIDLTVGQYADGLRNGDVALLREAFKPTAVVCGYIDTELYVKDIDFLCQFVAETPSPASQGEPYECETTSVEVHGGVAVVTVAERHYVHYDYVTSLHLVVEDGRWWIVSKLFDGTPSPS
jgi:hypothetical protein